jgi:selenocysteine-specific elongation factor
MMLAPPGRYVPVRVVDARFDLLASAPSLKHRAPVHFHAGTAEVEARVRLLESLDPLQPGSSALVRFILEKPLPLLAGDRFIVRMFSPVVTIGGGVVLDNAPPVRRKRPFAVERLRELEPAPLGGRIALWVRESRCGLSPADLARRTPHSDAEIEAAAAGQPRLAAPGAPLWYLDAGWRDGLATAARQALAAYHRENPLQPGMPKEDLRGRVLPDAPPFVFEGVLAAARDIVLEGDAVRLASHRVQLKQDEEAALAKIESLFAAAGLAVPATSEVLAKSGLDPARARTVLQMLLRSRKLIPVSADLVYHASALAALREQLAARKGQRFSVPEFKDWTGVSRKYAIPLLEYLDRERVTRREGDQRVIV